MGQDGWMVAGGGGNYSRKVNQFSDVHALARADGCYWFRLAGTTDYDIGFVFPKSAPSDPSFEAGGGRGGSLTKRSNIKVGTILSFAWVNCCWGHRHLLTPNAGNI